MLGALRRCSATLPRTLSSLSSSTAASRFLPLRSSFLSLSPIATRNIHSTSRLRQNAPAEATAQPEASMPSEDGPITTFKELGDRKMVHPNIVRALTGPMKLETMTEVQTATINEALRGTDIIAQARTGTGKTLGFLIPVLQNIISQDPSLAKREGFRRGNRTTADDIRAIIISPTRELAEQIAVEAKRLVDNTGVIVQTAVGGTQKRMALRDMQRNGCHILVGTPGRLNDILSDEYSGVKAPKCSAFVMDEADRLLDQGFFPEIQKIMRLLPTQDELPRQTLMFSATVPDEVVDLVHATLKPGFQFVKTVRDDEEPTHTRVPQYLAAVQGFENRLPVLVELATTAIKKAKEDPNGRPFKAIVYFNSTAEVHLASATIANLKVTDTETAAMPELTHSRFRRGPHPLDPAQIFEIHAKLSQSQRTRAADNFRRCESGILLSSDVTARGMDFPNVTHVIQIGLPQNRDTYIHRIGRTARAGKEGEGWLIAADIEANEVRYRLKKLPLKRDNTLKTAGIDMTREAQIPADAAKILTQVNEASKLVNAATKGAAYRSLLGAYGWVPSRRELVAAMNDYARYGWGMSTPPAIAHTLAQRLGLSRIPGINIGSPDAEEGAADLASRMSGDRGGRGGGDRFGGGERRERGGFGGERRSSFGDRDGGRGRDRGGFNGDRDRGFGGRGGGDRGDRGFGGDRPRRSFGNDRSDRGDRSFGGDRGDRGFGGRSSSFER